MTLLRFRVKDRFVASKETLSQIETLTPSLTPLDGVGEITPGSLNFSICKKR